MISNRLLSSLIHRSNPIRALCTHRQGGQNLKRRETSNEKPEFPGSMSKSFTTDLKFVDPNSYDPIPMFRILNQSGEFYSQEYADSVDLELMKRVYKEMVKLNEMDIILNDAQRQGRISFYMTSYGEEATHFGPAAALNDEDLVFSQYREAGVLLWRGFTFAQFINQCFGNQLDKGKGRQMPIHYGSEELNFMTVKSTLTSQMLHAVGAAYAFKRKNKNLVTLCYFGDGAASEGDAYAAFNFAATLGCPIIFFCRNNGYAISTPTSEQYVGDGIAARGPSLGIQSIRIDGNDILACYHSVLEGRRICLEESRPVLIEAMTYRISHHSTSDDSSVYRDKDEIHWKEPEHPLNRIELLLRNCGQFDEKLKREFRTQTRKEIIDSLLRSEKLMKPSIECLFTDVYDRMTPILSEQFQETKEHLSIYRDKYPELSKFQEK